MTLYSSRQKEPVVAAVLSRFLVGNKCIYQPVESTPLLGLATGLLPGPVELTSEQSMMNNVVFLSSSSPALQALIESNFFWDSSISTKTTDKPIWPYTLDYAIPHECKIKSCPSKAFPGVWEIPVNLHYVSGLAGGQCSYLDQCVFALLGSDDVFDWLKEDFERHYNVSIVFLRLCNTIFFARLYYTEHTI